MTPDFSLLPDQPIAFFQLNEGAVERDFKRRYTALIKCYKPDKWPQEFMLIREAYEHVRNRFRFIEKEQTAILEVYNLSQKDSLSSSTLPSDLEKHCLRLIEHGEIQEVVQTLDRTAYEDLDAKKMAGCIRIICSVCFQVDFDWLSQKAQWLQSDFSLINAHSVHQLYFFELLIRYRETRDRFIIGHKLRAFIDETIVSCSDPYKQNNRDQLAQLFKRFMNIDTLLGAFPSNTEYFNLMPILNHLVYEEFGFVTQPDIDQRVLNSIEIMLREIARVGTKIRVEKGNLSGPEMYQYFRPTMIKAFVAQPASFKPWLNAIKSLNNGRFGNTTLLVLDMASDYAIELAGIAKDTLDHHSS